MYAMLDTQPDIAFAVSLCSRFMANPAPTHILPLNELCDTFEEHLIISWSSKAY
jgi:hypothetical protein